MAEDDTSNIAGYSLAVSTIENVPSPAPSVSHSTTTIEQQNISPKDNLQRPGFQTAQKSGIQHERREGQVQVNQDISFQVLTGAEGNDQYEKATGRGERSYDGIYVDNELHLPRSQIRERRQDGNSRIRSRSPKRHARYHNASWNNRYTTRENQEESQHLFVQSGNAAFNADQNADSRYGMGSFAPQTYFSALPQQHPGSRKHQRWCPIYIHTAKCDKCLRYNVDVLQRCVDGCSMQFCRFCLQSIIGRDHKHVAPDGGFDWTSKSKAAAKLRRSQTSASSSRGGALQADPLLAPFFHSSNRVISINSVNPTIVSGERLRSGNAYAGGAGDFAEKSYGWSRYDRNSDMISSEAPSRPNKHFTNDIQAVGDDATAISEDEHSEIYSQNAAIRRHSGRTYEIIHPAPGQLNPSITPGFGPYANPSQEQHNPRLNIDRFHPPGLDEIHTFSDAVTLLDAMRSRPRIPDEQEQEFQDMRNVAWTENATLRKIKEGEGVEEAERIFQAVTLVMRLRLGFYGVK